MWPDSGDGPTDDVGKRPRPPEGLPGLVSSEGTRRAEVGASRALGIAGEIWRIRPWSLDVRRADDAALS